MTRAALSRTTQVVIDFGVLTVALWVAFVLRFELDIPSHILKRLVIAMPYVILFQYGIMTAFNVPNFSWRYVGLREISRIFLALLTAASVFLVVRLFAGMVYKEIPIFNYVILPAGVVLIDLMLAFMAISGVRVLRRLQAESSEQRHRPTAAGGNKRTLLVGAGEAGLVVAKELKRRPDLGITPVGFLDDDPSKIGTVVHGLRVLGPIEELPKQIGKCDAEQVLITIAKAAGSDIRRIREECRAQDITTRIIPGLYEIVGGMVNLSRIREVGIEDLLRRDPVDLDATAVSAELNGKVVFVTGAGGSIGSEICRQVIKFGPATLVMIERSENALFQIERELRSLSGDVELVPCVADVCDRKRMAGLFAGHRPDVVFHAAAHKHVPMMEWNPGEAVKNNVLGTKQTVDLACEFGCSAFVMISTDKAVNPTSVMGASKRVAEMYCQSLAATSKTKLVTVRFGNVLGSAGSVVPIFKEQIARGGPVTVTHPDMRRYFMTIPEACQLVLQAGSMGDGGEIFVLDMGEPVRIVDLAKDLISLSGLTPDEDIAIEFSGIRPGEKLFEELSLSDEQAVKTHHPKIFVGVGVPPTLDRVGEMIDSLGEVCDSGDPGLIRECLSAAAPEYKPAAQRFPRRSTKTG